MRLVVTFDAAVAGVNVGAGASDGAGEDDRIIASGVSPPDSPFPVETPPRDDSPCRSSRSASMSMLKSRAAV